MDISKETLAKIHNVPKGATRLFVRKEKYGYWVTYDDPITGSQTKGFLSQVRIDHYLSGRLAK